jgi:thioesterase domain-containing protein
MARQLQAHGQTVDLLVLMDPMPLPQDYRLWYRVLRSALRHWGALARLSPEQQVAWFVRLRHLVRRLYSNLALGHRRDEADAEPPALASLILTDETLRRDYFGILDWAVLDYRPASVYQGKITFFWPVDKPWHARRWRQVADATEVEVHRVPLPANHVTWQTDYLHVLSEHVRRCLDKAQGAAMEDAASARKTEDQV